MYEYMSYIQAYFSVSKNSWSITDYFTFSVRISSRGVVMYRLHVCTSSPGGYAVQLSVQRSLPIVSTLTSPIEEWWKKEPH